MGKFLAIVVVTLGVFYLAVYGETLARYDQDLRNAAETRARVELTKENIKDFPLLQAQLQKYRGLVKADKAHCLPYKLEAVKADLKSIARAFPKVEMGMSPEIFMLNPDPLPPSDDGTPEVLQGFGFQGAHLRLTGPRADVLAFLTAVLKSPHRYVIKSGKLNPEGSKLTGEVWLGPIPPPPG